MSELWPEFFSSQPFGLALTVGAYALVVSVARRLGGPAWLNPVLWSVGLIVAILLLARIDYADYMRGGGIVTAFLGPAVVALAVPLHQNRAQIRRALPGALAAVGIGSLAGIIATVVLARLFGASPATILAVAPKHATSPVALAVSELAGGPGELAAVIAILTGILGAAVGPWLLRVMRIDDERHRGLAIGVSSHAIGTARALEEGPVAGSFSVVGMVLAVVAVTLLVPMVLGAVPAVTTWLGL